MSARSPKALLACLALVATAALGAATTATSASAASVKPTVYPVPQELSAPGGQLRLGTRVALVEGEAADAAASGVIERSLHAVGVADVDHVGAGDAVPGGVPAVYLGGTDDAAGAMVLRGLGADGAASLAAEGYVLATGRQGGQPVAVLQGHDATGQFYAAQSLRQLLSAKAGNAALPVVTVRDWPAYPLRGVIEGFYGTPWSHQARLDQLSFYGEHKMNTYVYSPKDDAFLRARWRDAYPPAQLAQLKELVDRAVANHVKFTYALSPGLSVCYSSPDDLQALVDKFQSLWDVGVRDFAVPLDDISYTSWNCAADQTKFGTGGGAAGAAQSYLLNAVQRELIDTHPGAGRLQFVPTEYYDVSGSAYKTAVRTKMDPDIIAEWTGVGVVAPVITRSQAAAAKSIFGHDILVWDNYPVNDYVTSRLLLGPYVGRDAGMSDSLFGITANPMIQPEASKISLFNVADFTWNDTAYDPDSSWQASLDELAGGKPGARAALAAFADLEYYSNLDKVQAPALAARTKAFWTRWEAGENGAAAPLDAYLRTIETAEATLVDAMGDPAFVSDAKPWLDASTDWGKAARAALAMLVAQRHGDAAEALADRSQVNDLVAKAKGHAYVGLGGGSTPVLVGDGVIDAFINTALAENDRWFGLSGRHATAMASMSTYQSNTPDKMLDGDDATYYWSSEAARPGAYVGVDLGAVQDVTRVVVHAGKPTSPDDYIHAGVLEYSADGTSWTQLAVTSTADVSATPTDPVQARYVRLRATSSQTSWVVVREFAVTGPTGDQLTAAGAPPAASGSSLARAVDGSLDTAYVASRAPQTGEALTVTLPVPRPLDRVEVAGTGSASVQVRVDGSWRTLGQLAAGYTELKAHAVTADAIRLAWAAGSPAPRIAEVVPRYADVPVAELTLSPAKVEAEVGGTASVVVGLASDRARNVDGTLTVAAPGGLTAQPESEEVTIPRGSVPSVAVSIGADRVGEYAVPVTFVVDGEQPVTETLQVSVHPKVDDTNVAAAANGGVASASSVEADLPQFTPDHANDGDRSSRWSSGYTDTEWLQVRLASPQHVGKVVLRWEAAHANAYDVQVSSDGSSWRTAAHVTGSQGGVETVWVDQSDVRFVRMQGVDRTTSYGYSVYELEAYPVAE
jgi:hyaluronoglucosaminidase